MTTCERRDLCQITGYTQTDRCRSLHSSRHYRARLSMAGLVTSSAVTGKDARAIHGVTRCTTVNVQYHIPEHVMPIVIVARLGGNGGPLAGGNFKRVEVYALAPWSDIFNRNANNITPSSWTPTLPWINFAISRCHSFGTHTTFLTAILRPDTPSRPPDQSQSLSGTGGYIDQLH